jgi:CRISPR type I-E-associated protein CasB/Cse2
VNNEKNPEQWATELVERLSQLRDDRGAMANLRRGLSPATEDRAWPWIARWCDITNERQRTIYTAVAAAFATHPETADQGNMGTVMREIAQRNQKGDDGLKTFEAHFRRFLNCHSYQEVCERLPGVVRMAKQQGISIDYRQLFLDLCYWGDRVKIRWAAAYWGEAKNENKQQQGDAA